MTDELLRHWPAGYRHPTDEEFANAKRRWDRTPGMISLETAMMMSGDPDCVGLWLPMFYADMTEELKPWFKWMVDVHVPAMTRSI